MHKAQEFNELEEKSIEYISKKRQILGIHYYRTRYHIKDGITDEIKAKRFINDIEKYLFPVNQKRILDVGCGLGGLVTAFRLKGAEAIGFDIDASAIEIGKLRARCYGFNEDCFFIGDAEISRIPIIFLIWLLLPVY